MKNRPRTVLYLWRTLLLACATSVAVALFAAWSKPSDDYDLKEARERLERIGQALQLYRKEIGTKPIQDRRTFSDAGLPKVLQVLAQPGHKWSLIGGLQAFRVNTPDPSHAGHDSHLTQLYREPALYAEMGDMSKFYAIRGEKMPVLADTNMNKLTPSLLKGVGGKALVLRLDGSVSFVDWNITRRDDLLEK